MNANPAAAPIANLASLPVGKDALHAKLASFPLAILRRLVQELDANNISPLSDANVRQSFYQPSTPATTRADILLPAVEYWQQHREATVPAIPAPAPVPTMVQAMAPVPSPAPVAPAPAQEAPKASRKKDPRPAPEATPAASGAVVNATDVVAALQSRLDALPTVDVTNVLAGKINVLLSNQEKILAQLEAAQDAQRKILGLVAVLSQGAFINDLGERTFSNEVEPLLKELDKFTSGK